MVAAVVFVRKSAPIAGVQKLGPKAPVRFRELLGNLRFALGHRGGHRGFGSPSSSLYIFLPFSCCNRSPCRSTGWGWFTTVFFLGYLCGRLALGRFSQRHGAPNIVIVSKIVMTALIVVLILILGDYAALAVMLFLLGVFTRGTSPLIRAMVADSMDERTNFHDAFGTYSFASRGSSALSRPIFGCLTSFGGIAAVFYLASAISLLTVYPTAKFKE